VENLYVGIDIGGTNTKYALVTTDGTIISKNSIETNSKQNFETYSRELFSLIKADLSLTEDRYKLISIGVGAPNANPVNGKIENPPNLAWGVVDVVNTFQKQIEVPVILENDANIAAIGEKFFGLGKELSDFIVITLGTGVGVGTYINAELFSGAHGIGSEAGHMIVAQENRSCSCGGIDHLESYLSSKGIKQTAFELLKKELRFREIKSLYESGDSEIKPVITKTARILAGAMCSMSALINPQMYILSGGVSNLGVNFLAEIEKHYRELVYSPFQGDSKIKLSEISLKDGAVLGAAALAINRGTLGNLKS
jgi:glucokinase